MPQKTRRQSQAPQPAPWFPRAATVLVSAAVLGSFLVFLPAANDVYVLPKEVLVGLASLALLMLVGVSLATHGSLFVSRSRVQLVLACFVFALGLSALLDVSLGGAIFGSYGRASGVLAYGAAAILFCGVAALSDSDVVTVLRCMAVAGGAVGFYGALQVLGFDPLTSTSSGAVVSSLGQVNFVAGISGLVLPLLGWVGLDEGVPVWTRWVAASAAAATVVAAAGAHSFQAYLSLLVGVGFFALAAVHRRLGTKGLQVALVAASVGVLSVVAIAHGKVDREVRSGLDERVLMWRSAGELIQERPLTGWGPTGFAREFARVRPAEHARRFGLSQLSDAPHDVPLSMLVTGGPLLLVAYLAFVSGVGVILIRGIRRTNGGRRMLLCTAGAGWAAYLAQSLVSIDVPTFITAHMVLAGAIVAVAGEPDRLRLSAPSLVRRRRNTVGSSGKGQLVLGAVAVLGVVAAVLLFRPFMGDLAYASARDALASKDLPKASSQIHRATGAAGHVPEYWALRAAVESAGTDQQAALSSGERASHLKPSVVSTVLATAQLADKLGQTAVADRYYRQAMRYSPHLPTVTYTYAVALAHRGDQRSALAMAERAVRAEPTRVTFILLVADVQVALGRLDDARATYRHVQELEPENEPARIALRHLPPSNP
jgi:O-antigen ligase/cytochrome c-type biogenesis protein CcmH/NrfG